MRRALPAAIGLSLLACTGTTGGEIVTFAAYAVGPADADPTGPLTFTSGRGYQVTLTRAKFHIGGVYLDRSLPVSGAQDTSCVLPGTYVGQVTAGLDVDALSPLPQPFPIVGEGNTTRALAGEVWLTGGDVDAPDDETVVLDVAGTAEKDGMTIAFSGTVTIGQNRAQTPTDPSLPGSRPICKQRIVSPIPTDVEPAQGGALTLRIDPRQLFASVDFRLGIDPPPDGPGQYVYTFPDTATAQPDIALYQALRSAGSLYSFEWR